MSGWAARAQALGSKAPSGRGSRWLARQEGRDLAGFAELAAVPAWLAWNAMERRRLAAAAALLHHRPQIDGELRGEVLAPLAALAGETLFDAVCASDFAGSANAPGLPAAAQLGPVGEQLLARSWCHDQPAEPYAVAVATTAAELVRREAA